MKFNLTIDCDNAAFDGSNLGPELFMILQELARVAKYYNADDPTIGLEPVFDSNGNRIGTFGLLTDD